MVSITKADYFTGVFLIKILKSSKVTTPAYFDATDHRKRVEFETDMGKFNVFIQYSTSIKSPPTKEKSVVQLAFLRPSTSI